MKVKIATALIALSLALSCSKSSDPNPAQSSGSATATVNGKSFTASDVKVTDTGGGLEIKMAAADEQIKILTDDKKAGTYTIVNTSGRAMANTSCSAIYLLGSDVYLATSGSVTITVDTKGNVSSTYAITFKNSSGIVITIKDGKLSGVSVTPFQVPAGKCLVSTDVISGSGDNLTSTAIYDSDGKLLRVNYDNGSYELFVWAGGVVTSHLYMSPIGTVDERENWFYTNAKLTKVMDYDGTGKLLAKSEYTLNAAGQPTTVVLTESGLVTTWTYTYDANGNCTSTNFGSNDTETYSNYDSKPNPIYLSLSSLGVTFYPSSEEGLVYSKNNVGKVVETFQGSSITYTFSYTYNAKGNVETSTRTYGTDVSKDTYSYTGCN